MGPHYLLHFGYFGHVGTLDLTAIYYTSATWGISGLSTSLLLTTLRPLGVPESSRSGPKRSLRGLNWCHFMFCEDSSLLNSSPLNFVRLNSSSLNSIPSRSSPLNSIPLRSSSLNSIPLRSSSLNSRPLTSSQLNSIPLNSSPLNFFR